MGVISGFKGQFNPNVSASIPNGQQETNGFFTGGFELCGVMMPALFTGTHISFEAATTIGGTYQPVSNASGAVVYPAAASQYIAIDPKDFHGIAYLKIKSDAAEGAARTLVCSMKGI